MVTSTRDLIPIPNDRHPILDQLYYLDSAVRENIRQHFGGHVGRAFEALQLHEPIWISDTHFVLVCKSEFYRAMKGGLVRGSKIERIELRWVLLDKGTGIIPPVPRDLQGFKSWIQKEFGFLRTLHEKLFADWSYATLRNTVAGIGIESRLAELYVRLDAYREDENARRREPELFSLI